MKFKHLLLPALAMAIAIPAGAVKAIDKFVSVVQPDGTTLQIKKHGDESSHFLTSTDGALLKEVDGTYFFGTVNEAGRIVSTGVKAADPANRTAAQRAAAVTLDANLQSRISSGLKSAPRRTVAQDGMGRFTSNFPRKGDIRSIVILVSYKDVDFTLSDPYTYFNDMLNKDGFDMYSATGCAAEYFRFNSNEQFRPVFDVFGPVKLPNNRSYYGSNDWYGNDVAPEDMVIHAVQNLDPTVDFSKYDMDGDGYVDNIFVIYAGQGEASYGSASTVWPHSWTLSEANKQFKVDGVTVDSYGCTNEWEQNRPDGVGTFTHEFSHVMGLPDLYDTYNNLTCTPNSWSVLDYGPYNNDGCTPPNYSSFERLAMGWIDPYVITGADSIDLTNLADSNEACIIQTDRNTEYYLFENRQNLGWDKYLPGHGMLIWHIDFVPAIFDNNTVNINASHQYVELKKANGILSTSNDNQLAGWSWPGTANKHSFTDDTTPSMKTWNNKKLGLPITDITEANGIISFNVCGGIERIAAPVVKVPEVGMPTWFDAEWEPVEGATEYFLTVLSKTAGGANKEYFNNMGNGNSLSLPAGWVSSATDVYTTNTNYGAASPSYKMNKDESYMLSPVFDTNVIKIQFWHKGMQLSGGSLEIQGIDEDGNTVSIASITPAKSSSKTDIITDIPDGVRQVKFIYHKVTGNLAIDDIAIVTDGYVTTILKDYNRVSTGGQTKVRVAHPAAEEGSTYHFYVEAYDGNYFSRPSATIAVPELNNGGESAVATAAAPKGFTLSGRVINAVKPITVTDLSGRILFNGVGKSQLPAAGVYVVRCDNAVGKLMVK